MIKLLESSKTQSRGFIIDGIPLLCDEVGFDVQMEYITKLVQQYGNCVLIDMRISNQDLLRRRAGLWLDPVTNDTFPAQQVLYSRQRRQEGWIDGEEDTIYKEENDRYKFEISGEEPEAEEALDNDNEDDQEIELEKPEKSDYQLANRRAYPILAEKVLDRLIKLPDSDPEQIQKQAELYIQGETRLELFRKNEFNLLRIIELDATQHPEQLYTQLLVRMHSRGFSVNHPYVPAVRLTGPESGFKGVSEQEIMKFYNQMNIQDHEPEREFSEYSKYCPVAFKEAGKLVATSMEIACKYKGKIYFFLDEPSIEKFISNPDDYLKVERKLPITTICVMGTPISGKSSISKVLAARYNLACISVDEILLEMNHVAEDSPYFEIFARIKEKLTTGGQIDGSMYVEIIRIALKKGQDHELKGWILDGFPKSAEQANLLVQEGIIPEHVYLLQSDASNEIVNGLIHSKSPSLLRSFRELVDPMPFYDDICQHFSAIELLEINITFTEKAIGTVVHNVVWRADTPASIGTILQTLDPFVPQPTISPRLFDAEPNFGVTRDFCPVKLFKEGRLQKGDPNIVAKFMGRFYYFVNEEHRAQFMISPYVYIKDVKIPPPRLAFMGPSGSGKSTLMKLISEEWNIPQVDFKDLLTELGTASTPEIHEQIRSVLNGTATLGSDVVKQALQILYTKEPYLSQGFLLKSFPLSKSDLDAILKAQLYPDAFILFRVESDVAVKRKLKARLEEIDRLEKQRLQKLEQLTLTNPEALDSPENLNLKQTLASSEEKVLEELAIKHQMDSSQLAEFQTLIENTGSVPIQAVNTSKCMRPVLAELKKALTPYLQNVNYANLALIYVHELCKVAMEKGDGPCGNGH
jgi:adenylate kinase family enzyme/YHS domain-containing protein